ELLCELNVGVRHCAHAESADALLASNKFDAVVIDCETLVETTFGLERIARSRSSNKAVVFVIARGASVVQQLWRQPAHFVLDYPIERDLLARALRIAYGLMLRERRRYYRHPVDISAQIGMARDSATIRVLNISEGGLAVQAMERLNVGDRVA